MSEQLQRYFFFSDDPPKRSPQQLTGKVCKGELPEPPSALANAIGENRIIIRPRADYEVFCRGPIFYALGYAQISRDISRKVNQPGCYWKYQIEQRFRPIEPSEARLADRPFIIEITGHLPKPDTPILNQRRKSEGPLVLPFPKGLWPHQFRNPPYPWNPGLPKPRKGAQAKQ